MSRGIAVLAVIAAVWAATGVAKAAAVEAKHSVVREKDLLVSTLAGEYALQAGRLDEAATWYLDAAQASANDAGLAERATRIALLANEDALSADALKLWRARAPRSQAMRAALATLSLRRNDGATARQQLQALLKSSDPDGWRYALVALSDGKNPKLSAQLLNELIEKNAIPEDLQSWLAFGGLAQRLDQSALAERIVNEVVKRFPGKPRVALLRASQLREAGKPDEAKQVLVEMEAASDATSEKLSPDLRLSLAAEYDALNEPSIAAAVLARGPQDDQIYALRASLLAKAEDKTALSDLYAELERGSSEPEPRRRLLLGQAAEFLGRYEAALLWYRSVPGGAERWQARLRAASVLHKLGKTANAYADLRALQSDASVSEQPRIDAYLLEAELRAEDKNLVGEFDAYERGLAAHPDDGALLYSRALMWERRDNIVRAEADLRKLLVAEPDDIAALNALGYTLADRTTRFTEALELIDRARAAEPENVAIIDSYGWVLYRLGRNDEALIALRRAFSLEKDPEIAAHLGEVLWFSGERQEAKKYFDAGRKLDPENRALQRALEKTGA